MLRVVRLLNNMHVNNTYLGEVVRMPSPKQPAAEMTSNHLTKG